MPEGTQILRQEHEAILKMVGAAEEAAGHVSSSAAWRPSLGNDFLPIVLSASEFSRVSIPQAAASSSLDYRIGEGFNVGFRFQYGGYINRVHPEQTGFLRTYTVFAGKTR